MNGFEPCPYCRAAQATRIRFTPWGGVIGPMLLSLVKCAGCGGHFNGRNGRSVKAAIRVYTLTTLIVLALIVAMLMYQVGGSSKPTRKGLSVSDASPPSTANLVSTSV